MTTTRTLTVATAIGMALTGAATAQDYRMATFDPPNGGAATQQAYIAQQMAERTNGEISFEVFYASSLVPPNRHMQAIGSGVAHAGFHSASYTPSELRLSNAMTGFGFIERDPTVIGMAFADWTMNDPEARAQYTDEGILPFGGFSTPTYPLICNTAQPITSPAQFEGLKVRFPGGSNAALTQHLGGVAVNIPGNELYQALQTGTIDCAGILAGYLNIDNNLQEVAQSVTLTNWSGSFNSPIHLVNLNFWRGLTNEQRQIYFEVTARATAQMQTTYNINDELALNTAREFGLEIVEPDAELQAAVDAWVEDGVGDMAGIASSVHGIEDPEAFFASFQPYLDEWRGLIDGMENVNDVDALTQVILDNMYSGLDPAMYGM